MSERNSSFIKKTIQLILVAFLAKGLGFIREMVLANYYGASYISDVFIAVQNIPSIIFTIFGMAVTTGFIPIYTDIQVKKSKEDADKFANNLFNIFLIVSVLLTVLGTVFSKQLVKIFAGGFSGGTLSLCNKFAKIVMPTSVAIILVYIYNAYLQIEGHFNQNSLMNVPYNIIQMICIALAFYVGNAYILAIGLLLASYSQLVYLKILMRKSTKFKHSRYINFKEKHIIQMLILVGPVFISTGVNQINNIVDKSLASGLIEGSVSALNYASEVANIITQVIILSLTTVLYPKMTELFAQSNKEDQNLFTEKYINIVLIIVLPLASLLFIFSEEIVKILFGRGAFDSETVIFVSNALKIYAIGIVGASFRDVLNKVFYAMKNTVIPMANGIIAVIFNIVLNFVLISKYEYLGLASATAISSIICTLLMFIQLIRKMRGLNIKLMVVEFAKALVSTIIMVIVIYWLINVAKISNELLRCILFGSIGGIIYLLMLLLQKEKVIQSFFESIKKNSSNYEI